MWKDGPAQESLLSSPRPRQAQGCHRTKRRPWLVGSSPGSSFAFLWKEYRLRQFKLTGSLGKEVGEGYNLLAPFSAIVRQDVVLAFTSRTAHWGGGGSAAGLTGRPHRHSHAHVAGHVLSFSRSRVLPREYLSNSQSSAWYSKHDMNASRITWCTEGLLYPNTHRET